MEECVAYRRPSAGSPGTPGRHDVPDLYVIAGPEGSGKSSVVTGLGLDLLCTAIIDPCNFARGIADMCDGTGRCDMATGMCTRIRGDLLGMGAGFGFETTASDDGLEFVRRARDRGYRVNLVFVSTSDPDINVSRIGERVRRGGHGVPEDEVRSGYERTVSLLPEYLALSDEAVVLDNSGDGPVIVLTKTDDGVVIADDAPGWVMVCIPSDGTAW